MTLAPKTNRTCFVVLALGLCLAAPASALSPSIQPVIAPFETGLVSLGRLLDGVSGWLTPWADPGIKTTECSDQEPPEGEEDDSCGAGQTQDPNGTSGGTGGTGGTGSTGSGTPSG